MILRLYLKMTGIKRLYWLILKEGFPVVMRVIPLVFGDRTGCGAG